MLSKEDILALLPHRPPFLWLDRIVELDPGVRCVGIKAFARDEQIFSGHFPGDPIVPGVILIEAAAQTAAVMLANRARPGGTRLLAAVNRFKFLTPVRPDAELIIETRVISQVGGLAYVEASVRVGGAVAAGGELSVYSDSA